MKIAETFKSLRLEKGLTQKELAEKLNIGQSTVNNYENENRAPIPEIIIAYSKFFNVSTDYLLGLEDEIGGKAEKKIDKKISSEKLSTEEIEMIKKIRLLGPYEQTYIKAQIDALSDTAKSKQKEKI